LDIRNTDGAVMRIHTFMEQIQWLFRGDTLMAPFKISANPKVFGSVQPS
jgi:hypothetical protein